jgi:hypothetical protein
VRRRLALAGVVGLALALLTGCVTIPTGGGVSTQRIAQEQGSDDTIRAVSPPLRNATPSEIVAGFVRAGGGPDDRYGIAREFLTESLRAKWKPSVGTLISDSAVSPIADGESLAGSASYSVSLDVVGQIDSTGVYTPQSSAQRELDFHLVKEHGQWRIDRAPEGTVLRSRDLGLVVQPYDLYFFDPGYDYLVPDLRWFADQGDPGYVPGRIVGALLAGPARWLASPVVVSAFPADTQVGEAPVLDSGTMTVDLSPGVLDAGPTQQQRMLQQLTWSLRGGDVRAVTMTANGLSVPVSEASSADGTLPVPYEAIGSDGKAFGAVTASGVSPLPAIGEAIQALAPSAVAVDRDRTSAAVRGTGGVSLVTSSAHPVVDARSGLIAPSLDPQGYVWSAQGDPGSLIAVRSDGRPHAMPITASGQLVSIAVSRDGTRLLVALATDTGARLLVLGIQRDKDGAPTGFGSPLDLSVESSRPIIAAAWVDTGSVAVVTGDPNGQDRVTEYQLGGVTTEHGVVRGGRSLAAGANGSGFTAIRVLLASGDLAQPSLVGDWQSTGAKLSLLGTQQ